MQKNYSKSKIGFIGGGSLFNLDILRDEKIKTISTCCGKAFYYLVEGKPLVCRHGPKGDIPPHRVNYRANICALEKMGVKYIFSFNSVGSLKINIKPGQFLILSDYIDLNPVTFFEEKAKFITPELSERARKVLINVLRKLKIKFKNGGIYFQTKGPRLETKAEINLMKKFADVVGMTMSREATLANELNLEYISLCSVDNYANGISKNSLSVEEIKENQKRQIFKIEKIIKQILKLK